MPYASEKYAINNPKLDRRVKLTDEQRESIREEYATGFVSQQNLADKYGVSKRLVQFILNPKKKEIAQQQFRERQKDGRYYDKDKHREYTKEHRRYKNELYKQGLLTKGEERK